MADDKTEYRIEQLEDDVSEVKADVKKILTNDLPHILAALSVASTNAKITLGIASAIFIAVIVGLFQ